MALDYSTINGLYTKYLGRQASQDEATNWMNGTYGSDPYGQIPSSGEAQAYASKTTGDSRDTGVPGAAPPNDMQQYPGGTPNFNEKTGQYTFPAVPAAPAASAYTPTAANAPSGFDQTKWADPTHTSAKYVAGRILASGGSIQQAAAAIGATVLSGDKLLYNGDIVDVYGDFGGANTLQWSATPQGGNPAPVNLGGGGRGSVGSPPPGLSGDGWAGGGMGDKASALYDILLKRATQSEIVDPNDPIIRNQTDAYANQQSRQAKNYLSAIAEKAGPNANIGAETRIAGEQVGQATSAFQATLMGQELAARRQEIESALSGAAGFLTSQQQMALQYELQQIANAQQLWEFQQSQGQQESQFARNLAQTGYEFDINDQFRNSPLGS